MKIEIFDSGCAKCKQTEKIIRKAVKDFGIEADIIKVEDMNEIINRGVVLTPAIFIDGMEKIGGHVPNVEEIIKLIK
jgi:small redox-active disulfide protein 2